VSERHASERVVQSGYLRGQQAATYQYRCVSAPIPTVSSNAQLDETRAGALPSSAHHIHVARPSYNTDDRRFKAPRQRLTWWFCGASSRRYGPPAGSGI